MKITIIGAGGVGGYFGGRLALSGNEVTFVARGEHLRAIQQRGLLIKSTLGQFTIQPARASNELHSVETADLVLVCTKAWQVRDIGKQLAPLLRPETMVMPLQNGILAATELAEYIPRDNIVGGLCRIFSLIESPGVINHRGIDPTVIFGELDNRQSERAAWLQYTFQTAGISHLWADDIEAELWKKFLMICSSALLAVCHTNYGELRSMPETRQILEELYTEIYQTGLAAGVKLPNDLVAKTMKAVDQFPPESTSSLTRDVWEGKPSEIEYQNGTVVRLGNHYGIPTPVNRFVYYTILPQEQKARQKNL